MGTASTMACVAEALGMTVPGGASPPAVTADRIRVAEETGATRGADGAGRPHHRQDPDARRVSKRDAVLLAIGGIDQRHRAPGGHCRARWGSISTWSELDRMGREPRCCSTSSPRASTTWKTFPRRRHGHAAARTAPAAAAGCADRDRAHAGRRARRPGPRFCTGRRASAWTARSTRRAASRSCAAIWRPAAPSSSSRRPTAHLMEHEGRAVVFENAGPGEAH
jgi:dihydroxy-acid dehydratase